VPLNEGIARASAKDGNCTETVEFFFEAGVNDGYD